MKGKQETSKLGSYRLEDGYRQVAIYYQIKPPTGYFTLTPTSPEATLAATSPNATLASPSPDATPAEISKLVLDKMKILDDMGGLGGDLVGAIEQALSENITTQVSPPEIVHLIDFLIY